MSAAFLKALEERRSIYQLNKTSPISDDKIVELVQEVVKHSPSSFNSQSSRAVVLIGAEHDKFWGFVKDAIKAIVPAEAWPASEGRLNGFLAGHGSVLLFEDQTVVQGLQAKLPLYADKFPQWSEHAHGILAANLWTTLEQEGLGANLQHYSPLIDEKVQETWKVPSTWVLKAQLVFGGKVAEAGPKEFAPIEDRVKVYGK
ncbi:putative nitroreductase [Meredithblackwellia eburnea MCA 4105]